MKLFFISITLLVLSSCITNKPTVTDNTKTTYSSSQSTSLNSQTDIKEIVTDPVTMERCDKDKALEYEGQYFCSQGSLQKYKELRK